MEDRYTQMEDRIQGRRPRDAKSCRRSCPGGGNCCLDATLPHTLHICGNDACACHSQARYEPPQDAV